jgi:hypothetical protein
MPKTEPVDKPEPRWQAILALIAVGGIYTALPSELSVGPRWLLLAIVIILLVPAVVAHRTGRHSLNHLLGIITNSVITAALVGSLALLISGLPSHKEPPRHLLVSAASLWLTNVLTFALVVLEVGRVGLSHDVDRVLTAVALFCFLRRD